MPEKIDHPAEAVRMVDEANMLADAREAEMALATAQVHATLALTEQQRIVTIAYLRQSDSDLIPDDAWDGIDAEIREGLGL